MVDLSRQKLVNRPISNGDRATYSEIVRWSAMGALFVGLILVYSWNQMEILSIQYQMEELQRQHEQLKETNAALRAEYKSLTNAERVARKALELGLISSNLPQVKIIQAEDQPESNLVAEARKKPNMLHE